MAKQNLQANTPFGLFFAKIGIWAPTFEGGVKKLYSKLQSFEKDGIYKASAIINVINTEMEKTPDEVFKAIQKVIPDASKENVRELLAKLNSTLYRTSDFLNLDFEDALMKLQIFLVRDEGNVWINSVKFAASTLADILLEGKTPAQTISTLLEYVYRTFVKK